MLSNVIQMTEAVLDVLALPAIMLALALAFDVIGSSQRKFQTVFTCLSFLVIGWMSGWGVDYAIGNQLHFFEIAGTFSGIFAFDWMFFPKV